MINKHIPFDIWSFQYEDFENFSWPIDINYIIKFRTNLEVVYKTLIIEQNITINKSVLMILFNILMNEYLSIYENFVLLKKFHDRNIKIKYQPGNTMWNKSEMYINETNEYSPYYPIRSYHFNTKDFIKYLLRRFKNIYYRTVNIICNPNELTIKYLHQNNISVKNVFMPHYFGSIINNFTESELSTYVTNKIYEAFVHDTEFENKSRIFSFIRKVNNEFIGKSLEIYNSISQNNFEKIDIYAGTGANYYTRMLGQISKDQGGHLHCFEHGEGRFYYASNEVTYTELGVADIFYTFNNNSQKLYEKYYSNHKLLIDKKNIVATNSIFPNTKQKKVRNQVIKKNRNKIIYVTASFRGNKVTNELRYHDCVYLEWQKYLCNFLTSNGFDVYIKYHPGTILKGKRLELIRNVNYLYGNLGQYLQEDCIFLMDLTMTTAFSELLLANKKIVLIKSPHPEFHDEILTDLRKSILVVEAYHDEKNRIRANLNQLVNGINNIDKICNEEFVNKYYYKIS